jgi:hypothetical protein
MSTPDSAGPFTRSRSSHSFLFLREAPPDEDDEEEEEEEEEDDKEDDEDDQDEGDGYSE